MNQPVVSQHKPVLLILGLAMFGRTLNKQASERKLGWVEGVTKKEEKFLLNIEARLAVRR